MHLFFYLVPLKGRQGEGRAEYIGTRTKIPSLSELLLTLPSWTPARVLQPGVVSLEPKEIDLVRFSSTVKPSSLIKERRRREARVLVMEHKLCSALPHRSVLVELMLALTV